MPTDDGLLTDILGELGVKPEHAESDADETEVEGIEPEAEAESGADEAEAANDEAAADESAEPTEGEADDDAESGEDEPAAGEDPAKAKPKEEIPAGLKRELFRLREEIRQLKAGAAPAHRQLAPSEQEVFRADTPERLDELRDHFERLEDLAVANRDGVEIPAKDGGEPKVYSREQMGELLTNARRALRAIPKRQEQLVQETRSNQAAVTVYPGYEDPESDESRSLAYVLQHVPEIRRIPNYRMVIGDAIAGERARIKAAKEAKSAATSKNGKPMPGKPAVTTTRKVPAPVPGAPHRAPSAPTPKAKKIALARKRAESGSEADIARLIEAGLG